jgi:hypothetical protein
VSLLPGSFRLAARGLRRRPGFAVVSILTIALAVGANTAIFSVVNGTLLTPLPFREPERLVKLEARSNTGHMISLSIPNYRDWRDRSRGFESLALAGGWNMRLTGRSPAEVLDGRGVVGGFFGTLGLTASIGSLFGSDAAPVPLVRGRGFGPSDHDGTPLVAIIDETMARQFWPGQDPIGKRVAFETETADRESAPVYRTAIGVARNVRHYELMTPSRIQVYVSVDQIARRWGNTLRIALKTEGPPERLTAQLRALLAGIDPDVTLWQVQSLEGYVGRATARSRAMTRVLAAFGAGALALAALGIFGVMSSVVTRRTREIGIRMALGAAPGDVRRWVGARAVRLTAVGLVTGAAGAVFLTRLLSTALFEVSPLDAATYIWVTGLLTVTALVSAWLPARRAMRVDPATVMREEG